ncbi:MAG: sialate O-acetylesterase [Planctomycetia bacterium]|nr:sialate O-acetylesterase [Planctomycetia bacterium]
MRRAVYPACPPDARGRLTPQPIGAGLAADRYCCRSESFRGADSACRRLVERRGFRAVLWHQGESDANQKDASRTLPGELSSRYLTQLIRDSRRDIGWEAPWFVAQASYHGPDDQGSDDIRAAQATLWKSGLALQGPDTDKLGPEFREQDGRGVHFSGTGLRAHAAAWAEKIAPWLAAQFTAPRKRDGGTEWSRFEQLPECHAIGWVRRNVASSGTGRWDGVLDEAKWGTPSPQQAVERTWAWNISDDMWRAAVEKQGEGPREEVAFDLWVPDGVETLRGIVVMSGHGSGSPLFKRQDLRALPASFGSRSSCSTATRCSAASGRAARVPADADPRLGP